MLIYFNKHAVLKNLICSNLVWNSVSQYSTRYNYNMPIIFSGIQPTGVIHLGNYLGAIKNWVKFQNEGKKTPIYCIVDLHALTLQSDYKSLPHNIMLMAATLLACGIDPEKSVLYQQSQVLEHANLSWILSCLTTMPKLSRLPQFKEKSLSFTNKSIPTGLFMYPVLQSADILLHKATDVPVGEDQLQHIHLAANLSHLFNGVYGETFPVPNAQIIETKAGRIRSLRNPEQKMSKSEENHKSRIDILDPPEVILQKIKKAVTDFTSKVNFDPIGRPGVSNLMTIHQSFSGKSYQEIENECRNIDTGNYKSIVADILIEHLSPIRLKTEEFMTDRHYLMQILRSGSAKARESAQNTMDEVYSKVGFKYS